MASHPNVAIWFFPSKIILNIIQELGHPQPPNPIHVNNTMAAGIAIDTIKHQCVQPLICTASKYLARFCWEDAHCQISYTVATYCLQPTTATEPSTISHSCTRKVMLHSKLHDTIHQSTMRSNGGYRLIAPFLEAH